MPFPSHFSRYRRSFDDGRVVIALVFGLFLFVVPAAGQAPLHLVDENTAVRDVTFRFVGSQTFEASRLQEQIASRAPGFFSRLKNQLAFLPGIRQQAFPFDPIQLQRDVVRLRQFYQQNGFPNPRIDYPASQLDTSSNTIHVIFTIQEGTPLTIEDMTFSTADGAQPIAQALDENLERKWTAFRKTSTVQPGERYTDFKRSQIEDDIRTWLRDQGYAFAEVRSEARIDTTRTTAALQFLVDPGPLTTISEIVVEGNESVSKQIVRRELPFKVGDRFSAAAVSEGQRQLFDLNLFRVALADVPDQPRDSTVTVRYRVRETKLRAYSGQIGYGTQPGITMEGNWRHRNFYGDARTLIVGFIADTGYPSNPPNFFPDFLSRSATRDPSRLFRASVTLRQPYLFTERVSASLEPFAEERINPNLGSAPDRFLGLSERKFGVNTSLIYDILPFRTVSLQHSFARVEQFRSEIESDTLHGGDDLFDRSIFSISGTFGDADDFINPSEGFIARPSVEVGGYPFESGVDFVRVSGGLSGYLPVSDQVQLAGRVFGGVLWPFDESYTNLTIPQAAPEPFNRRNRTYQDRFSEYLFYGGGGSDVRGWQSQLGGGKVLRQSEVARANYVYRPIGARMKLGVNLESRLPFPGLGSSWRTAVFVDAAYLTARPLNLIPPPNVSGTLADVEGDPINTDPSQLLVGTGVGLRYQTPFGFLRLDIAHKLTPDALDLRRPDDVQDNVEEEIPNPIAATQSRFIRRFRLHFGIGRSF